ncbi:MAG: DNA internalization-related competence protein ComEC/Rec2 [Firmicutes bacterium]|nr:DNA internalization-related competence protein ComEC/Rec2 [Bacillota bacterium]
MIRRRLFAYTSMYLFGIVAAYICYERAALLIGTLFIFVICMIIARADIPEFAVLNQHAILIICVLAGFIQFTLSFIDINSKLEEQGSANVEGIILQIKEKDYGHQLILRPNDKNLGRRILLNCYSDSYEAGDSFLPEENIYSVCGSYCRASGKLRIPQDQDNPACFDYKLYLNSQRIKYVMTVYDLKIEENTSVDAKLHSSIMNVRWQFENTFSDEPEIRALIKGVIFGDKGEIDEETRNEFNENGTGHVLAVSGLHIGFLFTLLKFLTKKRNTRGMSMLILAIIVLYGEMTMWSPSTIRAVMVLGINTMAVWLRRRADMLTSVSFAALILLAINPYQLFNTGFQMSFLAMLGIAFFGKPLSILIGDELAIILAVQLAIAPYTALIFHRFNPLSVFINIPIVALASVIVPVCICEIGLIIVIGYIPLLLKDLSCGLMELLISLNRWLNFGSNWSFYMTGINIGILIGAYVILFLLSSEWFRVQVIRQNYSLIRKDLGLASLPIIVLVLASYNTYADDELVFVSVGQGDCLHIRVGSEDYLIDGGGYRERNIGENTLLPYLLSNGADRVDTAFVTHLHDDHYKGIEELASVYDVNSLALSPAYRHVLATTVDEVNFVQKGVRYELDSDCAVVPIWPVKSPSGTVTSDTANEFNTVYIVYYRGTKTMVTGDLLEEDELDMLQYYSGTDVLRCDVFKVGHHGSKSSSSEALLDAVQPEIAVISVGKDNMYGHPHEQTIKRLEERGIRIYRTDINGAVGLDINRRGRIRVDLMRPTPLDDTKDR